MGLVVPHVSSIRFFASTSEWHAWLRANQGREKELWVGFHKRGTGRPSITWPESVDVALCFGWIDGVRKSLGVVSYTIRFTPRNATSTWSAVNIARVRELANAGRMQPAGLLAFERRRDERSAIYAYEQRKEAKLPPAYAKRLRADTTAWRYFEAQAPWYRWTASYWVMSAKREDTREKRLSTLIRASAAGRPIPPLTRPSGRS